MTNQRKVVMTGKFTATNEAVKTNGKKVDAEKLRAQARKSAAESQE